MNNQHPIPVVLFAYARPDHLRRTLDCLRENQVPLLYVFSDGPKTPGVAERVREVRRILHKIDWCEVHLVERTENLGLGKSILTGVTEVFQKHEAILVFEDDLICVPGTYKYLCAALEHYKDTPNVMSVTGFTLPTNTPSDVVDQPYFDGRTDCLVWGTWARYWKDMDAPAYELMKLCEKKGIDVYRYGAVLPALAKGEGVQNTWAARFSYLHILHQRLCLRPPYSMVDHIGNDRSATNSPVNPWPALDLVECPPIPVNWPEPIEHPDCAKLWQKLDGYRPIRYPWNPLVGFLRKIKGFIVIRLKSTKRKMSKITAKVWANLKSILLIGPVASLCSRYLYSYYSHLQWRQWHKSSPEWFDHRIDYYRWPIHLNPHWAERGIYSKEVMFAGCNVLDVACGDGFYAKYFYISTNAAHIDCIDINPKAIDHAIKLHNDSRITYYRIDAIRDEFPNTSYDVACFDGAIDHFSKDDLEIVLKKIKKVLGEDGVLTGYQELNFHEPDKEHPICFVNENDVVKTFRPFFRYVRVLVTHTPGRVNCYLRCSDREDKVKSFS